MLKARSVMSVTDAAAARIREIIENADRPVAGIRVGLKTSGCAGMAYQVDLVETPDPRDDVVEEKGVKVFIDPAAVLYVIGSTMDFRTSKLSSGFVFDNPNQTSACGCGESVALAPANPANVG
ncbi:MAG TPA: Fe-S cluster assembly scaffold SufA [Kaistiaceae bacterium]|nr:Fe-S cluster assembly scaffold SufA [Kaistiaceae bacterium]